MKTEDAGDYGGTCDTCAQGQVKPGHRVCPDCERRTWRKAELWERLEELEARSSLTPDEGDECARLRRELVGV
jgi:hypothetical protein